MEASRAAQPSRTAIVAAPVAASAGSVADSIRELMSAHRVTLPSLAEQAGIPLTTLHRRMTRDGGEKFTVQELAAIAAVFAVTPRDLFGLVGAA